MDNLIPVVLEMSNRKNNVKWMSPHHKKVYQYYCATYFKQGLTNASEAAYTKLLSLTEAQVLSIAADIKNGEQPKVEEPANEDAELLRAIKSRYTKSEIKQLMNGVDFHTDGKIHVDTPTGHHKIGVLSDTHIGSLYSPPEWLDRALDTFEKEGCECIIHCGDVVDGIKAARKTTQVYELTPDCIGYRGQKNAAIKAFKDLKLPMYVIEGNHDTFFQDDAKIVEDICDKVDNMHYISVGKDYRESTEIEFDGAKVRLFHGGDGFSNMRLKNLASSEKVALDGVTLLLAGHVHKYEWKFIDGCHCFNVPTLQYRSSWMRGKKLYADCGFLVLEFDVADKRIMNLQTKFYNLCN